MPYPEHFLRGIINEDFLIQGLPGGNLFSFQPKTPPRPDNYKECSIVWKDKKEAIRLLLKDKKEDNTLTYKVGVGVFSTTELDRIKRKSHCIGKLKYERDGIGNPFHGNLLVNQDIPRRMVTEIASSIALTCYVEIIPSGTIIKRDGIINHIINRTINPIKRALSSIKSIFNFTTYRRWI